MRPGNFRPASALCLQTPRWEFACVLAIDAVRGSACVCAKRCSASALACCWSSRQQTSSSQMLSGTKLLDHVVRIGSRFWPASLPHG